MSDEGTSDTPSLYQAVLAALSDPAHRKYVEKLKTDRFEASKKRAITLQEMAELKNLHARLDGNGNPTAAVSDVGSTALMPVQEGQGQADRRAGPPSAAPPGRARAAEPDRTSQRQSISAERQAEVVDLSQDSDEETRVPRLNAEAGASSSTSIARRSPRNTPTAVPASSAMGSLRVQNSKRPANQMNGVETPQGAKRAKTSAIAPQASYMHPLLQALVDAVPASLNQRVAHMQPIVPTRIPPQKLPSAAHPMTGWVKRKPVFVDKYGAAQQSLVTKLRILPSQLVDDAAAVALRNERRINHKALFAKLDLNPGLPTFPGKPGTLITSRDDVPLEQPLLVVVKPTRDASWLYVGLYKLHKHDRSVTAQEWKEMPKATRNGWARMLAGPERPTHDCYFRIALRLALSHSAGSQVPEAKVEEAFNLYNRSRESEQKKMLPSQQQVLEGLERGYDTIGVLTLEPIAIGERLYEEIWDARSTA
ncbi:unnamed protein product [Peniophora sp. CBMAI 1063]|nr:unnamed protein product [Peniophora sp. CBMAI 1063]